jgi:cytochrome c
MLRHVLLALLAVCAATGISATAAPAAERKMTDAEARKFFNAEGCKSCHAVEEFRIGPTYQMIAMRYQNAAPETIERLSLKVLHGGAGAWGNTPMISHPYVSIEEAERIVRWILATPKPG